MIKSERERSVEKSTWELATVLTTIPEADTNTLPDCGIEEMRVRERTPQWRNLARVLKRGGEDWKKKKKLSSVRRLLVGYSRKGEHLPTRKRW